MAMRNSMQMSSTRPFTGSVRPPAIRPLPRLSVRVAVAQQDEASSAKCSTCGIELSKADKGCDGQGRIIGGLGAVPGFGWWPIKAYRPCPKLDEAGIEYVRKGQATNDVLFGGVSLGKEGSKTLDEMRKTAEKGIRVE